MKSVNFYQRYISNHYKCLGINVYNNLIHVSSIIIHFLLSKWLPPNSQDDDNNNNDDDDDDDSDDDNTDYNEQYDV